MLTAFSFESQDVRVVLIDGEPWFVAKDVCDILSIANVSDALSRLDDDEKNTIVLTDGIRGNPNALIISESGMYALILGSRKPEARPFRKWITSEVIPSIRKTGKYQIGQDALREEILKKLVPADPMPWQKCFADDFWKELERLYGYRQGNIQCAKFINRYIYDQFPVDVRSRLETVNPLLNNKRKCRKHQHLDEELRHTLEKHLTTIVCLMQASATRFDFECCFSGKFHGSYQLTFLPQIVRSA